MTEKNIKRYILAPLALALLIMATLSVIVFYQHMRNHMSDEIVEKITSVNDLFEKEIEKDAALMSGLIDFLQRDPCLRRAFKAQDREELLQCATPLFQLVRHKYRVTHFYFHDLDRVNFLRVHNPPRFGDHIGRFTMARAAETGEAAYGIELGPFGTFTLRQVVPWHIEGELAGYIELGEEIEHITPNIKQVVNADLVLLIDKHYLKREKWEEGQRMMGREGDWEQISDFVIIDHTRDLWTPEIESLARHSHHETVAQQSFALEVGGHHYQAVEAPLLDADGRHVGHIVGIIDVTAHLAALKVTSAYVAIGVVTIGSLLFVFFNFYLGRIQHTLITTHERLQASLVEYEETAHILREHEKQLAEEVEQRKRTAVEEQALSALLRLSLQPLPMENFLEQSIVTLADMSDLLDIQPKGAVFLTEHKGKGKVLDMVVAYNISPELLTLCARVPFGTCLCGLAATTGEVQFANCSDERHVIHFEGMPPHSHFNVPIKHGDRMLGVLALYLSKDYVQKGRETKFLLRVADVLSMGILRRYDNDDLVNAKDQAEEASRAKSVFMATMSHELRTPMNGILGMAELLRDTELDEDQQQYVEVINEAGKGLMDSISGVLDFSKIDAGRLKLEHAAFDLESAVSVVVQSLLPEAREKDLELKCQYAPGCPRYLIGDAMRIHQVLLKLVENAIKFTYEGQVLVDVAGQGQVSGQAEITIAVQDTGIGITPNAQDSLFQAFTQVDSSTTREYGGIGLGLAICKQLVELMGGDIGVQSTPREGSKFWFTLVLPMSDAFSS